MQQKTSLHREVLRFSNLLVVFLTLLPISTAFTPSNASFRGCSPASVCGITLQAASGTTLSNPGVESQRDADVREVVRQVFNDKDSRPVILFDGVCNLCNGGVNLALDWDPRGHFRFAALQSNVGRALLAVHGKEPDDISSIVLVTNKGKKAYFKSDAILRIGQELTPPADSAPLRRVLSMAPVRPAAYAGRLLVPKFVRDLVYDGVANNRYSILGKRDQCRFDADGEFDDRFIPDEDILAL